MFRSKVAANNVYFLSDMHLNHKNIVRGVSVWDKGYRDFDTIKEMNDTLIDNINSMVGCNDLLFDLGDSFFGDKRQINELMSRINCKNIVKLFGNHDKHLRENYQFCREHYLWFGDYLELYIGKRLVVMSHYAMKVWNESHRGSYHLFGHSHALLPDNIHANCCDVGMDAEYGITDTGRLFMTASNYLEPVEDGRYADINNAKQILHKRFHPFAWREIETIMSYKQHQSVDHHNRKNME